MTKCYLPVEGDSNIVPKMAALHVNTLPPCLCMSYLYIQSFILTKAASEQLKMNPSHRSLKRE